MQKNEQPYQEDGTKNPFNLIPQKKISVAIDIVKKTNATLLEQSQFIGYIYKYADFNIPVDYWFRDMHDFKGVKPLFNSYEAIAKAIDDAYAAGTSFCFGGPNGVGKQLDLDTDILTINGFIKLRDLKEGDKIFDENGDICDVIKIHPVQISPESFLIKFDDGSEIKACADHLWLTYTFKDRRKLERSREKFKERKNKKRRKHGVPEWLSKSRSKNAKSKVKPVIIQPSIKTTKEMFETLMVKNGKKLTPNHSIPCAKPLKFPCLDLAIDPYVLGCWLGDGPANMGNIETADQEILDHIKSAGYSNHVIRSTEKNGSKSNSYRIGDLITANGKKIGRLKAELKSLNLLNNKHIPEKYLRASYHQRLLLIQGLMDTDGTCDDRGSCEFCSTNENIASGFLQLALSLGIKANIHKHKSFLKGIRYKDRYRVVFSTELQVFKLSRKRSRQKIKKQQISRTSHRFIIGIEKIDPIPMKCITVNSQSHLYLVSKSLIPTHNTMACSCILKRVAEHGKYSGLYVNLTDIINVLTSSQKEAGRRLILASDFLVIDEFDQRFIGSSDNAADLFGRLLESTIRSRLQNKLPTFLCTNNPKPVDSFSGALKISINSLMKMIKIVPVVDKDHRGD